MPRPRVRTETAVPHLILVGLMGSGKSSVGRRVAEVVGRPFVDTDQVIENREGRSIRQMFDDLGEDGFRDIESEVLRDVLADGTPSVVATGGGVVSREENRRLLAGHDVVWLRASVDTLAERLANGTSRRPLLDGDPRQRLVELDERRRDLYQDVASTIVDVDGLDLDTVVTKVCRIVGRV